MHRASPTFPETIPKHIPVCSTTVQQMDNTTVLHGYFRNCPERQTRTWAHVRQNHKPAWLY